TCGSPNVLPARKCQLWLKASVSHLKVSQAAAILKQLCQQNVHHNPSLTEVSSNTKSFRQQEVGSVH
uniref:G protein gamma domain-containing protein n=1 Tax=Anolis carolinensis TaxID=28377 RepID=A0A803SMB1_ANOCA